MSVIGLDLTESQCLTALRSFLLSVLTPDVEVVQGQVNRVPEPKSDDFIVFTPLSRERLETNVDTYADTVFTGSIAGDQLSVLTVEFGVLSVGRQIFGVGVAPNTFIKALQSATGGVGVYLLTNTQTLAPQKLAGGIKGALQPIKLTVQIDVHGPASADNSHLVTTLFRDEFGFDSFAASGFAVVPLYTDDPKQMPFINAEQQVEQRWTFGAVLQCNPTVFVPQQFADQLAFKPDPVINSGLIDVDVVYPPV